MILMIFHIFLLEIGTVIEAFKSIINCLMHVIGAERRSNFERELFEYFDELRNIFSSFKSLNVPSIHCITWTVYYILDYKIHELNAKSNMYNNLFANICTKKTVTQCFHFLVWKKNKML